MEELERNVSYQVRDKEVHLGLQQQEFLASKDALLARHQAEVDKLHQIIQVLSCNFCVRYWHHPLRGGTVLYHVYSYR